MGISVKSFYTNTVAPLETGSFLNRIRLNRITPQEYDAVFLYALAHTELRHREMAYRMIDDNVAFMNPTSVYRSHHSVYQKDESACLNRQAGNGLMEAVHDDVHTIRDRAKGC